MTPPTSLTIAPPGAVIHWDAGACARVTIRRADGTMNKPKALDLFCKAGGATRGLQMAGYHVTGVDIEPQPRYCGDVFLQGDAFDWLERDLSEFGLIWASPKCQAHSVLAPTAHKGNHEVQLPRVLDLLRAQPVPYIVENVQGTQTMMRDPIMLCGSMFALDIWRHRWFEIGNVDTLPVAVLRSQLRARGGERHAETRGNTQGAGRGGTPPRPRNALDDPCGDGRGDSTGL